MQPGEPVLGNGAKYTKKRGGCDGDFWKSYQQRALRISHARENKSRLGRISHDSRENKSRKSENKSRKRENKSRKGRINHARGE